MSGLGNLFGIGLMAYVVVGAIMAVAVLVGTPFIAVWMHLKGEESARETLETLKSWFFMILLMGGIFGGLTWVAMNTLLPKH